MSDERIVLAEGFLREAVFQSRGRQAVKVGLAGGTLDRPSDPKDCGLGKEAAVDLDLTDKGRELSRELWPEGLGPAESERVHTAMTAWIDRQDSLDRKRNHYIRDFRQKHGFDRREYSPELLAKYDAGLEDINREVDEGLRRAAEALVG